MIMIGYADNHQADCYRMYNPITDRVLISHDVRWAKWTQADPTAALKTLQDLEPPVEAVVTDPTQMAESSDPHVIPADDMSPDYDAERMVTRPKTRSQQNVISNNIDDAPLNESAMRARAKLETYYNPVQNDNIDVIPMVEDDDAPSREIVNMVMSIVMSDPGEPKNLNEALTGINASEWRESLKAEINNFIKRDAWKQVSMSQIVVEGRKPIHTKTVFKAKDEQDGTKGLKSRIVSL
jgi:hypothetical protein